MATADLYGMNLINRAMSDPEFRHASPLAQGHSLWSGMFARDIDKISLYASQRRLLIIFRCPNEHSNAYGKELREGTAVPKPHGIGAKTGDYGLRTPTKEEQQVVGDKAIVSDYDGMCLHQWDGLRYKSVPINFPNERQMDAVAFDYIDPINRALARKIQHGFNDNHVYDLNGVKYALNPDIGEYFLAFIQGRIKQIVSKPLLRGFYQEMGLENWLPNY